MKDNDIRNGDDIMLHKKNDTNYFLKRFTIFAAAFGFGSYDKSAREEFKKSIEDSDRSIGRSKQSLKQSEKCIKEADELIKNTFLY